MPGISSKRSASLHYNRFYDQPPKITSQEMVGRLATSDPKATQNALETFRTGLNEQNIKKRYEDLYRTVTYQGLLDRILDWLFRDVSKEAVLEHAVRSIALSEVAKLKPGIQANVLQEVRVGEHAPLLDARDRTLEHGIGNSLSWLIAHSDRNAFADLLDLTHADWSRRFLAGFKGRVSFRHDERLGLLSGTAFPCSGLYVEASTVGELVKGRTDDLGRLIAVKVRLAARDFKGGQDPSETLDDIRVLPRACDVSKPELSQSAVSECLSWLQVLYYPAYDYGLEAQLKPIFDEIVEKMSGWIGKSDPRSRWDCYHHLNKVASLLEGNKNFLQFPIAFLTSNFNIAISTLDAIIENHKLGHALYFCNNFLKSAPKNQRNFYLMQFEFILDRLKQIEPDCKATHLHATQFDHTIGKFRKALQSPRSSEETSTQ